MELRLAVMRFEADDGINGGPEGLIHRDEVWFEHLVEAHYQSLYRFALSLTRREADARDLTQQTFYRWATKGHQLRDKLKAKSWLFQTLYREQLRFKGREGRLVYLEADGWDEQEQAAVEPSVVDHIDTETLMRALFTIDELYRAPLVLFYLEEHSYREIAEILAVPVGTVMSRLSRAKGMLRRALEPRDERSPCSQAFAHRNAVVGDKSLALIE
jgi:RNA polymerase sigma-70 factor (ECF subfamily)